MKCTRRLTWEYDFASFHHKTMLQKLGQFSKNIS